MRFRATIAVLAAIAVLIAPRTGLAQTPTPSPTPTPTATASPTATATPTATPAVSAPVAGNVQATLLSTNPPVATGVELTATQDAVANDPSFAIATYPAKGTLAPIASVTCVQTMPQDGGTASVSCAAEVKYTPVVDASGGDSFTYTFTNAGATSVVAVVAITLPAAGATAGPAPTAAPAAEPAAGALLANAGTLTLSPGQTGLVSGLNFVTWNGGATDQLSTAISDAGGLTAWATLNGELIGLVPGGLGIANQGFLLAFPDGPPAGTPLLIVR